MRIVGIQISSTKNYLEFFCRENLSILFIYLDQYDLNDTYFML